jgi:hypothetical protein
MTEMRTEESNDSYPEATAMPRTVVVFEHFMFRLLRCLGAGGHSKTLLLGLVKLSQSQNEINRRQNV